MKEGESKYFENKVQYIINYYLLSPYIKIISIARAKRNTQKLSCVKLQSRDLKAFTILKHRPDYGNAPVMEYFLNDNELCEVTNKINCLNNVEFLDPLKVISI